MHKILNDITKSVLPLGRAAALVVATATVTWWAASVRTGDLAAFDKKLAGKADVDDVVQLQATISELTVAVNGLTVQVARLETRLDGIK